jgi:phosphatidate cytidylyltransferase
MLKQRIITALILAPCAISAILYLPNTFFAIVLSLILGIAAFEWSRLSGFNVPIAKGGYIALTLLSFFLIYPWLDSSLLIASLLLSVAIGWLLITIRLFSLSEIPLLQEAGPLQAILGLLILSTTWGSLVIIQGSSEQGPILVIFLMLLIWGADSFAYFAGKRWGRVKLIPIVSPGKSREGVMGALAGSLLIGCLLAWYLGATGSDFLLILLLALMTSSISVVGDLFISYLKRQRGLKDTGSILPGHGGALDRIDSMLSASPVFLLGLMLIGVI